MSQQKGYETTCDRCGLKAFAPDDHPTLTVPMPQGWISVACLNGQLCPGCASQWNAARNAFMSCDRHTIFPPTKIHKE